MLKLCEFFGVEEDEEFEIIANAVKSGKIYRISCNILMIKTPEIWVKSELRLNDIIRAEIKKQPYKPKKYDMYYAMKPSCPSGYAKHCYTGGATDRAVEATVGFNRMKEDALKQLKGTYPNHPAVKE